MWWCGLRPQGFNKEVLFDLIFITIAHRAIRLGQPVHLTLQYVILKSPIGFLEMHIHVNLMKMVLTCRFCFTFLQVTNYLLDTNRLLDDDQTYRASLEIEPKQSRLSNVSIHPSWRNSLTRPSIGLTQSAQGFYWGE